MLSPSGLRPLYPIPSEFAESLRGPPTPESGQKSPDRRGRPASLLRRDFLGLFHIKARTDLLLPDCEKAPLRLGGASHQGYQFCGNRLLFLSCD